MPDVATVTMLCSYCERTLEDEELSSPYPDADGNPICMECECENFHFPCGLCEECEDIQWEAFGFAVFDFKEADLPAGIYRVLKRPFYLQPLIGRGSIDKERVEWIAPLPEGEQGNGYACAYLCRDCCTKHGILIEEV